MTVCPVSMTSTAKYSAAGSVAGRMDLGIIYNCGGYGDTASESGDYVGGVCGQSLSAIRASWAKCTLSGGKYVGGIAGSGARVTDCAAMVEIAASTQLAGAIAGEITDDYSGNRFVSDTGLAGVDRVSYAGRAESVAYAALVADESVPDEFRTLTLSFLADGKTLSETAFRYGQSFGGDAYPAVPGKGDCYVRWDREELQDLRFDTRVEAVYEPYVTALAAGDTADGRPALLVEGSFRRGDALSLSDQPDAPDHGEVLESWSLRIPDDGAEPHRPRLSAGDQAARDAQRLDPQRRALAKAQRRRGGALSCLRPRRRRRPRHYRGPAVPLAVLRRRRGLLRCIGRGTPACEEKTQKEKAGIKPQSPRLSDRREKRRGGQQDELQKTRKNRAGGQ